MERCLSKGDETGRHIGPSGTRNAATQTGPPSLSDGALIAQLRDSTSEILTSIKELKTVLGQIRQEAGKIGQRGNDPERLNQLMSSPLAAVHYKFACQTIGECTELWKQISGDSWQWTGPQTGQQRKNRDHSNKGEETSRPERTAKEVPKPARIESARGDYVITMTAKTTEPINPANAIYEALGKTRTQILQIQNDGLSARIRLGNKYDLEEIKKKLDSYRGGNLALRQLYHLTVQVKNCYTIRTDAFGTETKSRLPFLADGVVAQKLAEETLFMRNKILFEKRENILFVVLHRLERAHNGHYSLIVMIDHETMSKISKLKNIPTLDLEVIRLAVKLPSIETECFRCLETGHKADHCQADQPTCRHCRQQHESRDCPEKKNTTHAKHVASKIQTTKHAEAKSPLREDNNYAPATTLEASWNKKLRTQYNQRG